MDRFTQFAVVAGSDAIQDSRVDLDALDPWRGGVIVGSGIGGLITISDQMEKLILKGPERVSPLTIPRLMLNAAGGNFSIAMGCEVPITVWPRPVPVPPMPWVTPMWRSRTGLWISVLRAGRSRHHAESP